MWTEGGYNLKLETKWLRSVIWNLHTKPHSQCCQFQAAELKCAAYCDNL